MAFYGNRYQPHTYGSSYFRRAAATTSLIRKPARLNLPGISGANRRIEINCKMACRLRVEIKEGLNPRRLYLRVKGRRNIPLATGSPYP